MHSFYLRCGNRFVINCPDCSRSWRHKVTTKFKLAIENMTAPKFITLTLKKDANLDVFRIWTVRNLLFRTLRRRGFRIGGWCGVLEWPNHIHLVVDCDYIPQAELSDAWLVASNDSFIVDIRAIRDGRGRRAAINYLSKYLGKSQGWEGVNLSLFKGFHLQNNHGLQVEKPVCHCPCECGVGPLVLIPPMEWDHNQSFFVVYDDDT